MAMIATMRCHRTLSCYLLATGAALLLVFLHAPLSTAQPLPWQLCNATAGNFTENSAYQANIRRLVAALPSNASSSPSLFATGSAGTPPDDAVYALALCRGDGNASSCARCVAAAAQQFCTFNKGATMYDDPCILRYADWDFLANVTDNRGIMIAWNYDNVSASVAAAMDAASGQLVNATSEYAAADAARHFGTGEMGFDETYPEIYSLAQCTPDMTAADCRTCLGDIYRRFAPKYFVGKHGGRVFGVRCSFRFETYSFFSGRPLLKLPGPPGPPPPPAANGQVSGRRNKMGLALAIALPLAAAILALAVTCFCFWSRRRAASQKDSAKPCKPG